MKYHKIRNAYVRDKETRKITDKVVSKYADKPIWKVYEKMDGRNIRFIFEKGKEPIFKGRNENSEFSKAEAEFLTKMLNKIELTTFNSSDSKKLVIYFELFGEKVQKNPYNLEGFSLWYIDALLDGKFIGHSNSTTCTDHNGIYGWVLFKEGFHKLSTFSYPLYMDLTIPEAKEKLKELKKSRDMAEQYIEGFIVVADVPNNDKNRDDREIYKIKMENLKDVV